MSESLEQKIKALKSKLKLLEKAGTGAAMNAAATASKIRKLQKLLESGAGL